MSQTHPAPPPPPDENGFSIEGLAAMDPASPAGVTHAGPTEAPTAAESAQAPVDKVSSVDLRAELGLLAAVFTDAALLDELGEKVSAGDFAVRAHEVVFAAMTRCDSAGRAIDPVTVADELTRSGELKLVGGLEGVRQISWAGLASAELGASAAAEAKVAFSDYVEIVYDRATRRRLLFAARQVQQAALAGESTATELVQFAEAKVFGVSAERAQSKLQDMPTVTAEVVRRMALARQRKLVGVSTGFPALDELTGGLQPGQMVTIGARPGMGKSVLLTQMCHHIAATTGDLVPMFSYEMNSGEIGMRLLARSSGIPLTDLMRGWVPNGMDRQLAESIADLDGTSLLIDDQPPSTIQGVRSVLRRLSRRGKIAAVGLDYVQLIGTANARPNGNRENEVSEVSRTVKQFCDELGVPTILAAQLNRLVEGRPNKVPQLSDLRESGSLEQDSTVVILVNRPHMYDPAASETDAELIVAKNRNGATRTIYADWDGPRVHFSPSDRTGPTNEVTLGGPGAAPPVNGHGADGSRHDGPRYSGPQDPWG